jgi:hypothetical protein
VLALASDGTVAALLNGDRTVVVVEVPSGRRYGELELDTPGDGGSHQIAWLGMRLLVASRYAEHTELGLVEPTLQAVREIADLRIAAAMSLVTSVGVYALFANAERGVVVAGGDAPALHPLPSRAAPTIAGPAGEQFIVAQEKSIQEWDPASRKLRRQLRVPKNSTATAVGGSTRLVWYTSAQTPKRVDVIALVNRSQPASHELPEPIRTVVGHPRHDLIGCIGADSGQIYLIDLDRRPSRADLIAIPSNERVATAALSHDRRTLVVLTQSGTISCFALDPPQ